MTQMSWFHIWLPPVSVYKPTRSFPFANVFVDLVFLVMELCRHLAWINLDEEHTISMHDESRLQQILSDLTDPQKQRPSLIFFVDRKAKNIALRKFFPYNNIKKGHQDGLTIIRVNMITLNSEHSILFADNDITFKISVKIQDTGCHEKFIYGLQWQFSPELIYSDIIHARFFFLFTDVICIFADNFINLDNVVKRLKSWTVADNISNVPKTVRSKIVIVLRENETNITFNILKTQDLRFNLHQQDLIDFFSFIVIMYFVDHQIFLLIRHRRLKKVILRHVNEIRQLRQNAQSLYSATYFARFFRETTQHVSRNKISSFNFINVNRRDNLVQQNYCEHVFRFLHFDAQHSIFDQNLIFYIASNMIMNAFSSVMHCEKMITLLCTAGACWSETDFKPRLVYNEIYKSFLIQIFRILHDIPTAENHSRRLQRQFSNLTSMSTNRFISTAQVHQKNIRNKILQWSRLRSNGTCFACLRRQPEHTLIYEHALCDICVQIFESIKPGVSHQYYVQNCPLCGVGNLLVTLKPPTADVKVLIIDKGGVRGVVLLEFLRKLQNTVGPECAIQNLFDLAFDINSGKYSNQCLRSL